MNQMWLAGGIFLLAYALIVRELVPRMVAALLGGMFMIVSGVIDQAQAFETIDWNVIFLLLGMMIIASILSETGLFQWIAIQAVRLGRGDPFYILLIPCVVTAVSSAFLDNVTIVVLIAPVTLFVATRLGVSPIPFLIACILASNIGGAATLIGDPPNILIGSAAGYDFLKFITNMGPIALVVLVVFLGMCFLLFRRDLHKTSGTMLDLDALDAGEMITHPTLLIRALIIMALVVLGFLTHGMLHLEPATVAMTGATLLLLWARSDPHKVLEEVEWTTLVFFMGLFILVEGVVAVGLIEMVAQAALRLTGGSLQLTSFLILWMSAILSGIVDNIPYTATMIPVVKSLGHQMAIEPLWWSLALGACLGGNATLVGASANVVVANLAERSGHPIKFSTFLSYGVVVTVMSLLLSTLYVWIRYL